MKNIVFSQRIKRIRATMLLVTPVLTSAYMPKPQKIGNSLVRTTLLRSGHREFTGCKRFSSYVDEKTSDPARLPSSYPLIGNEAGDLSILTTLDVFTNITLLDQASFGANNIIFASDHPSSLKLSTVSKQIVEKDNNTPPGVLTIIKFAIAAVGVYLCSPLLSLIDTAAVGLLAGTSHQAALGPAVAITDKVALLLSFLYAATTNLVAATSSSVSDDGKESVRGSKDDAQAALISSLQLSLLVGTGLGSVLFLAAKILIRSMIGNDAIDPAVFIPAVQYVKIRALGMPAMAVLGSAQSACLGLKDVKSPLLVLLSAAVINLMGDIFFVGNKNPLLHGAAGAAWATTASSYAAMVVFLHWLKTEPGSTRRAFPTMKRFVGFKSSQSERTMLTAISDRKLPLETTRTRGLGLFPPLLRTKMRAALSTALRMGKRTSKSDDRTSSLRSNSFPTRGYLARTNFRKRDIFSIPSKRVASKFLPYVLPVTTTTVGRVSLFLTMSHVVSSCVGLVGMAAQQIVLALFDALCAITDSLGLTAQSFIPALHERALKSEKDSNAIKQATNQFLKVGALFGAGLVGAVACIPLISSFFSTDALVVAQVNALAPYLAGIFAMHGVIIAGEGVLLGRRDLNFLGSMYGIYFALVPAVMLRLKHAFNAGGTCVRLQSLWQIFLFYQISRFAIWVGRAIWLTKRDEQAVSPPVPASASHVVHMIEEKGMFSQRSQELYP